MNKPDLLMLFGYNRLANAKIRAACQGLSEAELHAPAQLSFGSIFGTLLHLYGTELLWRARLDGSPLPSVLPDEADVSNFPTLITLWQAEEDTMQRWLESLTAQDVEREVQFRRLAGSMETATVWRALLHLALHSMQFRAEAGVALSRLGHSPGDIDLLYYLRETNQR